MANHKNLLFSNIYLDIYHLFNSRVYTKAILSAPPETQERIPVSANKNTAKRLKAYLSLGNISFMSYNLWYFRWILLPLTKLQRLTAKLPRLPKGIAFFNIFGVFGYLTKIANDLKQAKNYLKAKEYIDLNGVTHHNHRKPMKAFFSLYGAFITMACAVSFYVAPIVCKIAMKATMKKLASVALFASQFSGILFAISSGIGVAKGSYSYFKNKKKSKEFDKKSPQSKYCRAKIKRNKIDIGFSLAFVAASLMFCTNPILGAGLLFGLGIAHYFVRKKQTKKVNNLKQTLQTYRQKPKTSATLKNKPTLFNKKCEPKTETDPNKNRQKYAMIVT